MMLPRAERHAGRDGSASARRRSVEYQLWRENDNEPWDQSPLLHGRTATIGLGGALAGPACAQDKPKLRFSAVFSEQDIRAEMMKMFADAIDGRLLFEGYYGGNLFKQGTELVALQRGNLEMGNIAPQDISKQIPAWSILTAGYLFRDAAHLKAFFASEARRRDEEDDRGSARRRGSSARPISASAKSA